MNEDRIEENTNEIGEERSIVDGVPAETSPEAAGIDGSPIARSRRKLVRNLAGLAVVVAAAGAGIGIAVSSPSSSASTGSKSATAPYSGGGAPSGEGFNGGGAPPGGGEGFPAGGGRVAPTASGTVASVDASGDTFTLKESSGTVVTVKVSSSTKYVDPGVSSSSIADVVIGKDVAVSGTKSGDTVTATRVMIGFETRPDRSGGTAPSGAAPGSAA